MQRKHLVAAYIAAFEMILSWDEWDGIIEMIMAALMFWGLNWLMLINMEGDKNEEIYPGNSYPPHRMGCNLS